MTGATANEGATSRAEIASVEDHNLFGHRAAESDSGCHQRRDQGFHSQTLQAGEAAVGDQQGAAGIKKTVCLDVREHTV